MDSGNRNTTALALLGAAFVLIALFLTPHGKPFSTQIDLTLLPQSPRILEITAPSANIDIVIGDFQKSQILAEGELHGFGWPGSRLAAREHSRNRCDAQWRGLQRPRAARSSYRLGNRAEA